MPEDFLPIPLEYRDPLCPLCGEDTELDVDGMINCAACGAEWPLSGYLKGDRGRWFDEVPEQCEALNYTVGYQGSNVVVVSRRCMRPTGHDDDRHIDEYGCPYSDEDAAIAKAEAEEYVRRRRADKGRQNVIKHQGELRQVHTVIPVGDEV